MEESNQTARQLYEALKAGPPRKRFGFGKRPALVNVDVQHAYTRPDEFVTAYETDPRQVEYIDRLARLMRERDLPVVWTHVAYSIQATTVASGVRDRTVPMRCRTSRPDHAARNWMTG